MGVNIQLELIVNGVISKEGIRGGGGEGGKKRPGRACQHCDQSKTHSFISIKNTLSAKLKL